MKAQELRIGNYVNRIVTPSMQNGRIKPSIDLWRIECTDLCSFEKFKPIPLTEQWLMDFGFKRGVDFWFNGDVILDISPEGLSYRFHYNIILHVHQLQNLYFALTGQYLQL